MSNTAELVPPPGSGNWHWVQTRPEIGDQIELAGWEPGSGEWIIYTEEGAWRFTAAEAHFDGWKHLAAVPTPEEIWGWKARAADYDRALKAEAGVLQKLNSCGVCYTPAEVAAREAAAFKRGQEAMREAIIARVHKTGLASCNGDDYSEWTLDVIEEDFRALPVEEMPT